MSDKKNNAKETVTKTQQQIAEQTDEKVQSAESNNAKSNKLKLLAQKKKGLKQPIDKKIKSTESTASNNIKSNKLKLFIETKKELPAKQKSTGTPKFNRLKSLITTKIDLKQRIGQKSKPTEQNTVTSNKLKLLITIVARKKAEYFTDLIQSFDVNMQMVVFAEGTASANILGLLGLSNNEKAVILGVIQESKIPDAMNMLEKKFQTIKDGKGIACTVPLTSVIGTLIYGFLSNNRMTVKENK